MQADDIALRKERRPAFGHRFARRLRPGPAGIRPPPDHPAAKGPGIARHQPADPAITIKPDAAPRQRPPDTRLPVPGAGTGHLPRQIAHRGQDQRPGQLGCGMVGGFGGLVRTEGHPPRRAGRHIDMRPGPAPRNQPQPGQGRQQIIGDARAFAEQAKRLCPLQAAGQFRPLGVIGPDGDVMARHAGKARQATQGIGPVIKDMNPHFPAQIVSGTRTSPRASSRAVRSRPADFRANPSGPVS